jgi:hypothetical protein
MLSYRARIFNLDKFKTSFKKYNENLGEAFKPAMEKASEVYFEAADELVPMETGALRRSRGIVQRGNGWKTQTFLGYGFEIEEIYLRGTRETGLEIKVPREYAVYQHEVPMNHVQGIDHFLEEGLDYYGDLIVDAVFSELKKVKI